MVSKVFFPPTSFFLLLFNVINARRRGETIVRIFWPRLHHFCSPRQRGSNAEDKFLILHDVTISVTLPFCWQSWSREAMPADYVTRWLSRWVVANGEFNGFFYYRFLLSKLFAVLLVAISSALCCHWSFVWCWEYWRFGLDDALLKRRQWECPPYLLAGCTHLHYWAMQLYFSGSRVQLIKHIGWELPICASAATNKVASKSPFRGKKKNQAFWWKHSWMQPVVVVAVTEN